MSAALQHCSFMALQTEVGLTRDPSHGEADVKKTKIGVMQQSAVLPHCRGLNKSGCVGRCTQHGVRF